MMELKWKHGATRTAGEEGTLSRALLQLQEGRRSEKRVASSGSLLHGNGPGLQ